MPQFQLPDFVGAINQGIDRGRQMQANQIAGEVYGADPSQRQPLLSQLAGLNPQMAVGLGGALASQDAMQANTAREAQVDHAKKLNGAANFMLQAINTNDPARIQGAWNSVRPYLQELTGKTPPEQFDPAMTPKIYEIVGQTGGMPQAEGAVVGNTLVDKGTGRVLYQGEAKLPSGIQELMMLQQNPALAAFQRQQNEAMRAPPAPQRETFSQPQEVLGPDGKPHLVQFGSMGSQRVVDGYSKAPASNGGATTVTNPDGSTTIIPGGKPNTQELTNAGFYSRMVEADKTLSQLEQGNYDPTNTRDIAASHLPGGNTIMSSEGQQYRQAAMNWIRANLRKESGAAIGKDEAAQEYANYFPQYGDSPAVVAQKAANRRTVENAMRVAAGPASGYVEQGGSAGMARPSPQATQSPPTARPRATNPQTGQTVEWDGQNWTPING